MHIDDVVTVHGFKGLIIDFWYERREIKFVRVRIEVQGQSCKEWYAVKDVTVITES